MRSMYVFTRKWGSPICHVLLTVRTKHASASTDINFIATYWALIKHQALLTIQAKLKLAIIFRFCFCFYFSVEIDSGKILTSGKRRETLKS